MTETGRTNQAIQRRPSLGILLFLCFVGSVLSSPTDESSPPYITSAHRFRACRPQHRQQLGQHKTVPWTLEAASLSGQGSDSRDCGSQPLIESTDSAFVDRYNVIVTHNLFRPLGYQPPVPRSPQEAQIHLIGTIIYHNGGESKAFVQWRADGEQDAPQFRTVGVGDEVCGVTVTEISSCQVILRHNGQSKVLRVSMWTHADSEK